MKKEWQKPVLEVLDVKMTMHNSTGTHFDDTYHQGTTPPTDAQGHMLILS
jgi:hypothetical protein